jgi:hypothetical protein
MLSISLIVFILAVEVGYSVSARRVRIRIWKMDSNRRAEKINRARDVFLRRLRVTVWRHGQSQVAEFSALAILAFGFSVVV